MMNRSHRNFCCANSTPSGSNAIPEGRKPSKEIILDYPGTMTNFSSIYGEKVVQGFSGDNFLGDGLWELPSDTVKYVPYQEPLLAAFMAPVIGANFAFYGGQLYLEGFNEPISFLQHDGAGVTRLRHRRYFVANATSRYFYKQLSRTALAQGLVKVDLLSGEQSQLDFPYGDLLVSQDDRLLIGINGDSIAALDTQTDRLAWKRDLPEPQVPACAEGEGFSGDLGWRLRANATILLAYDLAGNILYIDLQSGNIINHASIFAALPELAGRDSHFELYALSHDLFVFKQTLVGDWGNSPYGVVSLATLQPLWTQTECVPGVAGTINLTRSAVAGDLLFMVAANGSPIAKDIYSGETVWDMKHPNAKMSFPVVSEKYLVYFQILGGGKAYELGEHYVSPYKPECR